MLIFYRKNCFDGHLEVEIDYPFDCFTEDKKYINYLTGLVKKHGQFQKQIETSEQRIKDTSEELIFHGQIGYIPNACIPKELITTIIENNVDFLKYR